MNKKKIGIEGKALFQDYALNDHIKEMIALILIGANALDEETAAWFGHFDIVVSRDGKYIGIEVSFQVTTNSVIQRKSREANASYLQAQKAGHKLAYVVDGAGNFERHQAVRLICNNSDCTVAFTPSELLVLAQFVIDILG